MRTDLFKKEAPTLPIACDSLPLRVLAMPGAARRCGRRVPWRTAMVSDELFSASNTVYCLALKLLTAENLDSNYARHAQ